MNVPAILHIINRVNTTAENVGVRRKVVYLEQELTVWSMLNSSLDINGSMAGISDFGEDIVSEAGSDSSGISSHDGSKSDTNNDYNTEPSII